MRKPVLILLWCLVFILPWEDMFIIGDSGASATGARLIGVVAMAMAVIAIVASGSMRRIPLSFIPLCAFVLWNWLSLAWTMTPEDSLTRCITYSLDLVLLWLIWEFAPSEASQRSLMWAFVLGNSLVIAATYFEFLFGRGGPASRYAPTANNANSVALYAVFSICFLLSFVKTAPRSLRIFIWGYVMAAGIAALLSASRSGILGLAICILLTLVNFRRIGWKTALSILFCLVVGWFLLPAIALTELGERFGHAQMTRGADVRLEVWRAGLKVWESSPLLGAGAGTYPEISLRAGGESLVAHNTFIEVLVENGLLGCCIFVLALLVLLRLVWRMPPSGRMLWVTLLGSFSPNLIVGSVEYFKYTWLIFALIVAQADALKRSRAQLSSGRTITAKSPISREHPGT